MLARRSPAWHYPSVPVLSIVIPSKGRTTQLPAAVRSVLDIQSSDIECVISDNNDEPIVADLLGGFVDSRVKVVRPPHPLPMTDNFEFASRHASGEWLLFLGSDDGVVASRFPSFADLLVTSRSAVLTGRTVGFSWPGLDPSEVGGLRWFQGGNQGSRTVITGEVRRYLRARILQDALHPKVTFPNPYMHGAIRKDAVERIRQRHAGRLFRTATPDAFLSMAILHEETSYEVTDFAFGIQGVSPDSTGYTVMRDPSTMSQAIQSSLSSEGKGAEFLPPAPAVASVYLHNLECWATASGAGSNFASGPRDREVVIRTAYRFAWPQERLQLPPLFEKKWPDVTELIEPERRRYEAGGLVLTARSRWNGIRNRQASLSALSRGLAYLRKTGGDVLDTVEAAAVVTAIDGSSAEQIHAGFFRWDARTVSGVGIKAPTAAGRRSGSKTSVAGESP